MFKNIVIFSDVPVTRQEGGFLNPTNVHKLFNMIEDQTPRQIAFYDSGWGTDWRRITANAFGVGISYNIRECYEFLFENYQAGDRVYLFGFGRGAFTVRSLVGFVHAFGILPRGRPELIKDAYKIYTMTNIPARNESIERFLSRYHRLKCRIKFIGVWDTVGALGGPFPGLLDVIVDHLFSHEFHDTALSGIIEASYHALSIDDERRVFHPTLWDENRIGTVWVVQDGQRIQKEQTVEQVWFAGTHTDVGGGYEMPGNPALSDISLEWMVKKAMAHGLLIYERNRVQEKINPDAHARLHHSGLGLARFYRVASRAQTGGLANLKELKVHQSVLDRHEADKMYDPWILKGDYTVEPW